MSFGIAPPLLGLSIPLYNESEGIERVVSEIVSVLEAEGIQFVLALVDNGSHDGTRSKVDSLAEDHRITGVYLDQNAGYGGGIWAGIEALLAHSNPEIIGWTWGDGQVDPVCLGPLYRACLNGAPMAKAVRTVREDGRLRAFQGRAFAWLLARMGQSAADPHGCPKLFQRETLARLDLQHRDWFLDAEAMLGAAALHLTIAQTPVTMKVRATGSSKIRPSTTWEFCVNLWKWRRKQ